MPRICPVVASTFSTRHLLRGLAIATLTLSGSALTGCGMFQKGDVTADTNTPMPDIMGDSLGGPDTTWGPEPSQQGGGQREVVMQRQPVNVNRPDVVFADAHAQRDAAAVVDNDAPQWGMDNEPAPIAQLNTPAHVETSPVAPMRRDLSLNESLQRTLEALRRSDIEPMEKALIAAALSMADQNRELDYLALRELDPRERDIVERYQRLLVQLSDEIAAEGRRFDPSSIAGTIDDILGNQSVSIDTIALCTSVWGYGNYEEMTGDALMSGQDNQMILYMELEDFQSEPMPNGQYEVRLTQEVTLYHESDDLVVWDLEPVVWTDVSRNQRRDFFVAQPITIPQAVGVGRYRMKITVMDHHSQTMYEQTLPINIVADEGLARNGGGDLPQRPRDTNTQQGG